VTACEGGGVSLNVLAVGDVVGEEATRWLAGRISQLREELGLDWVIVNGENCAVSGPSPFDGFGRTVELVDILLGAGVDVITGGNHSWDGPEVRKVLDHPQVVRPVNVDETHGRGTLTVGGGPDRLTVVNMLSPTAVLPGGNVPDPQPLWPSWLALGDSGELDGAIIVDLHGESPWEKAAFATSLDGQITALVGTHTHDPTIRGHILPRGTGYVTELGMTGRLGFTGGGFDPAHFAHRLRGESTDQLQPFEMATGPMTLGAVLIKIDPSGLTTAVTRVDSPALASAPARH
jgi:2',3'-cyclic-nucleotide 2'-phosphodiesterase